MLKTLLFFLLLPFIGHSQSRKVLLQDYSFLLTDGKVTKLHQSNDTLYVLNCYIDRPCQPKPKSHYKIVSWVKKEAFMILKLERLDTILLTTDPYPATRYSVLALKGIDGKQLGYLPLALGLTKQQLDTTQADVPSLGDKFFFTYFSDSYLKELSAFKKVTTKEEASQILAIAKSDKYKPLAQRYAKTETYDMYRAGFSAELFNTVCIDNGYSPIGAGSAINQLMK